MAMKVKAEITAIEGGPGKRFAVTYPVEEIPQIKDGDTITFTIGTAWKGEHPPQKEQIVILEKVGRFKQGWRAGTASPLMLEDATVEDRN